MESSPFIMESTQQSTKSTNESTKTTSDLPNVLAEVALVIEVRTGGEPKEVKDVGVDELIEDADLLASVIEAVNTSEAVANACTYLQCVAKEYKETFPNAVVKISPCLTLKEPEEVK